MFKLVNEFVRSTTVSHVGYTGDLAVVERVCEECRKWILCKMSASPLRCVRHQSFETQTNGVNHRPVARARRKIVSK